MHTRKNTKITSEQLLALTEQIQSLHPELRRIKVKRFYHFGRVRARAYLGNRRVYAKGSLSNILDKISQHLAERLLDPFTELNPIVSL